MYTRPHGTSSWNQNGSREVRAATHASGPALATGRQRGGSGPPRRRASPVGEPLGEAVGQRRPPGLEASSPGGPAAAIVSGGLQRIEQGLKRGPEALGYRTSLWTA